MSTWKTHTAQAHQSKHQTSTIDLQKDTFFLCDSLLGGQGSGREGHVSSHGQLNVIQGRDLPFEQSNHTVRLLDPSSHSVFGWYLGDVNTCGISKQEQVSIPDHLITAPHLKFVSSVK